MQERTLTELGHGVGDDAVVGVVGQQELRRWRLYWLGRAGAGMREWEEGELKRTPLLREWAATRRGRRLDSPEQIDLTSRNEIRVGSENGDETSWQFRALHI